MLANLIVFDAHGLDVIPGMDWLSTNRAIMDCHSKEIFFRLPLDTKFKFVGSKVSAALQVILAIQVKKLLQEGCQAYLTCLVELPQKERRIEDIHVVREFSDVFLENFSGLPPNRGIDLH